MLIGLMTVNFLVAYFCVRGIIIVFGSGGEIVGVVVEAFFILELDDDVLPALWALIPYEGATSFHEY